MNPKHQRRAGMGSHQGCGRGISKLVGNEYGKDRLSPSSSITVDADVSESTDSNDRDHSRKRTSRLVNEGEELRGITLLSESDESSATTVNTGHTDGEDRHEDDDIHERIEADEKKTNNVEESDSPEDLLDGAGEGLGGVLCFCSSETDEFCSTEREGSGDKHTYKHISKGSKNVDDDNNRKEYLYVIATLVSGAQY
ncbi:hypothetical protein HG530_006785 [Fusarium avenaceum]|nr:hypothetical protein HG530_006785 [Fusarium avenaceum]